MQMAQDCEFGMFQDKALLIQFVCGIHSTKIQSQLLNKHDLKSFEKATLIESALEITGRQLEIIKQSDYYVNPITTNKNSYQPTSCTNQKQRINSRQSSRNRSYNASKNQHNQMQQQQRNKHVVGFTCGL